MAKVVLHMFLSSCRSCFRFPTPSFGVLCSVFHVHLSLAGLCPLLHSLMERQVLRIVVPYLLSNFCRTVRVAKRFLFFLLENLVDLLERVRYFIELIYRGRVTASGQRAGWSITPIPQLVISSSSKMDTGIDRIDS